MTITGRCTPSCLRRRSSSRPSISGMRTSVTMQPDRTSGSVARKATADSWVRTGTLALRSRNASESRMASSSSMTCTSGWSAMRRLRGRRGAQREAEGGAAARGRLHPDAPAMRLYDRLRDRQTHPHAVLLGGHERLKQLVRNLGGNAGTGIFDRDRDHSIAGAFRRHEKLAPLYLGHRLDGVAHQVEQDLLDLHLVGQDPIGARIELESHAYALLFGSDQGQRARLLDQLAEALDAPLALAAGNEIAQPPDNPPGTQRLPGRPA